jgi:virginiamycin A acetyltransferase
MSVTEPSRSDRHPRLTRSFIQSRWGGEWATVGDHTYGHPEIQEPRAAILSIGKYCSIADGVTIVMTNHCVDLATTYPFSSLSFIWPEALGLGPDHQTPGPLTIGNDVWLGFRSILLPGVKIGDGAIIAAGAIVTKYVPPYAVVAGCPARVIRYRFNERVIQAMLEIAWWNWSDEDVAKHLGLIMSRDIENFIRSVQSDGTGR